MIRFSHFIAALAALLILSHTASAQGVISGVVTDAVTREPILGATVILAGTTRGAATDIDGTFRIPAIAAGEHTVEIMMLTYTSTRIEGVVVRNGITTPLDVALIEQSEQVGEVVVTAVRRVQTEAAINVDIRNAMQVVSGVSGQSIARTQDRDAGEVVRRIPGIAIIDDKFIIARGLSQRYNNVWVNNAAVPSSEADSRAFSFDVIPAGQIENILIIKSPTPEVPADFTGGFIKINTKDIPDDNAVSIQYSVGLNTATHFRDFLYSRGFGSELFGFAGGRRMWSGGMKGAFDNTNAAFVTRTTQQGFNNDWQVHTRRPIPDQRFSAAFGKEWLLSEGRKLSLNGAVNYSYQSRTYNNMENSRYGIYNKSEDRPEYYYNYTDDQYQINTRLGAMLNLSYMTQQSRYYLRNLFNQIGQDKYTFREGWQNISSRYDQQKHEYYYSSRSTYNGQLAGVHNLGGDRLDWNAGYSYADRNLPDRRIINLNQNDTPGDPYYGKMWVDQNSIQRDFTRLVEHIVSAGANYEHTFGKEGAFAPKIKAGVYGEYRTRAYNARAFYYRYRNMPSDFGYSDVTGEILRMENYSADKLYLYDDSNNRNSYRGSNLLTAAYAAVQLPLGAVSVYAGARFEHSRMKLVNYTTFSGWNTETSTYSYADVYPSVNATWKLNDKHQLRAAYGMSTNRPEFREVSVSSYYDFDLFSFVSGNPDLRAAYIQNADIRYEWYPSSEESVSLSLFYKHFKNPIEATIRDTGGSYTYTFENADRANVYGLELDVRKNLGFMGMKALSVSLNLSLIQSRVEFAEDSREHDRAMQGQSPYIVNAGLFYQPERAGLTVGLLYNRIGKRIVGIGRSDLTSGGGVDNDIPDMYEMPRNALDLVVSKRIGKHWELKFTAKDLICDKVVLCQFPQFTDHAGQIQTRRQVTKTFNPGRSFTLGVGVKF